MRTDYAELCQQFAVGVPSFDPDTLYDNMELNDAMLAGTEDEVLPLVEPGPSTRSGGPSILPSDSWAARGEGSGTGLPYASPEDVEEIYRSDDAARPDSDTR